MSVRAKVLRRKCREGFFKLGIVGVKEKSWSQEVDEEAIGRSRGAEKPPKPVKSFCVSVRWITNVFVCVCVSMEQLQGTSLVHNKAIHLVHDSFNRRHPLEENALSLEKSKRLLYSSRVSTLPL